MDTLSGISALEQEQRRKVGYSHEELKKFVDTCRRCSLCQTRNKAVMGKGNLHSPVLFIAGSPMDGRLLSARHSFGKEMFHALW